MPDFGIESLRSVFQNLTNNPITGRERKLPVGVDGMTCERFCSNVEHQLGEISRMINAHGEIRYRFGPLLRIERPKETGGTRVIHIPRLRDQLVFRIIHENLLSAAAEQNCHLKIVPPQTIMGRFRESLSLLPDAVVLRTDITKFYDSVPRKYAVAEALKLFPESLSARLLERWSSNVLTRPLWVTGKSHDIPISGLPQGLSISSSLSEIWAKKLDMRLSGDFNFFRYVDDIAIICENKSHALQALEDVRGILKELDLELSESKTRICNLDEGISWLGLTHNRHGVFAESARINRWLRKFANLKRVALKRLEAGEESLEVINYFRNAIELELSGKTGSKIAWFAMVEDTGQWKEMDSALSNMARSLYRRARIDFPENFPSIHQAIKRRKNSTVKKN